MIARITGYDSDGALGADDEVALRQALVAARERAAAQARALERDVDQIVEAVELSPPDDEHDPEGATIAYERAQLAALLRQAQDDVAILDEALRGLDAGEVPRCGRCGGPIGLERLLALPTVRTCIACAARHA
jgi:RNA polymerase-binding transcription factor DksA